MAKGRRVMSSTAKQYGCVVHGGMHHQPSEMVVGL